MPRGRSKSRGKSSERYESSERGNSVPPQGPTQQQSGNGKVLSHTVTKTTTRHYKEDKHPHQQKQQQLTVSGGKPKALTPEQIAKKKAREEKVALRWEKRYARDVEWLQSNEPSEVQNYETECEKINAMPVNDKQERKLRSAKMTMCRIDHQLANMPPNTEQLHMRDEERLLSEKHLLQNNGGSADIYVSLREKLIAELGRAKGAGASQPKEQADKYLKAANTVFNSQMYSLRRRYGLPVVWTPPKAAAAAIADGRPLAITMGDSERAGPTISRPAPSVRQPGVIGADDDVPAGSIPTLNAQMNYDKALWTAGASAGPYVRGGDSLRYL